MDDREIHTTDQRLVAVCESPAVLFILYCAVDGDSVCRYELFGALLDWIIGGGYGV